MKVWVIRNKHADDFRKICLLFIRLTSNVLKLFPFAMVMCSVVWFYFCPEYILSDIVNDWHDADTLEKNRACQTVSEDVFYSYSGGRCYFISFFR